MSALLVSSISFADGNNSRIFRSTGQIEYGNSVLIDAQDFDRAKGYTDAVNQTTQSAVVQLGSNIDAQMTTLDRRVTAAEGMVEGVDDLLMDMDQSIRQLKVDVAAASPNGAGGNEDTIDLVIVNTATANGQRTSLSYIRGGTKQVTQFGAGSSVVLADSGTKVKVYADGGGEVAWKVDSSFAPQTGENDVTTDWKVFDAGYVEFIVPNTAGGFTIKASTTTIDGLGSRPAREFTDAWGGFAGADFKLSRGSDVNQGMNCYVTFNANASSGRDGVAVNPSGKMVRQKYTVAGTSQALTKCAFTSTDYNFIGWSTEPGTRSADMNAWKAGTYTGSAKMFSDQEVVHFTENTELYAIWEHKVITYSVKFQRLSDDPSDRAVAIVYMGVDANGDVAEHCTGSITADTTITNVLYNSQVKIVNPLSISTYEWLQANNYKYNIVYGANKDAVTTSSGKSLSRWSFNELTISQKTYDGNSVNTNIIDYASGEMFCYLTGNAYKGYSGSYTTTIAAAGTYSTDENGFMIYTYNDLSVKYSSITNADNPGRSGYVTPTGHKYTYVGGSNTSFWCNITSNNGQKNVPYKMGASNYLQSNNLRSNTTTTIYSIKSEIFSNVSFASPWRSHYCVPQTGDDDKYYYSYGASTSGANIGTGTKDYMINKRMVDGSTASWSVGTGKITNLSKR